MEMRCFVLLRPTGGESMSTELSIDYVSGNQILLDEIRDLWLQLNQHMTACSVDFKQHYSSMTFENRKIALLEKTDCGEMRVDIAVDKHTNQKIGYCLSSIDEAKTGEIESIFVAKDYRGSGVGGTLMQKALAWMDEKAAGKKVVAVGVGNEHAFGFYSRYGFRSRKTIMEQTKKFRC
jgi:ribosomal protein S18 acetylase RimI-like enzyme